MVPEAECPLPRKTSHSTYFWQLRLQRHKKEKEDSIATAPDFPLGNFSFAQIFENQLLITKKFVYSTFPEKVIKFGKPPMFWGHCSSFPKVQSQWRGLLLTNMGRWSNLTHLMRVKVHARARKWLLLNNSDLRSTSTTTLPRARMSHGFRAVDGRTVWRFKTYLVHCSFSRNLWRIFRAVSLPTLPSSHKG